MIRIGGRWSARCVAARPLKARSVGVAKQVDADAAYLFMHRMPLIANGLPPTLLQHDLVLT
jgi:hypothetical protein